VTISLRASSAWVNGAANITPTIPAGAAAGDMMLCVVSSKPFNEAHSMPAGWTSIGSAVNGSVAAGVDVGSMKTEVFWKQHSGTEANPLVTCPTNNVSGAMIIAFQKAASEQWATPAGAGGGDTSAGTGFSVTVASDPGVTAGDMCVAAIGVRSDAGVITVPTFTTTGITYGTAVESPAAALATTTGGDMAADCVHRLATAGTSSAAPVITATLAAAHTGSAYFVRLRAGNFLTASIGSTASVTNADFRTGAGLAASVAAGGVTTSAFTRSEPTLDNAQLGVFTNGAWYAGAGNNNRSYILKSTDNGVTWATLALGASEIWTAPKRIGTGWLCLSSAGPTRTSADGVTWAAGGSRPSAPTNSLPTAYIFDVGLVSGTEYVVSVSGINAPNGTWNAWSADGGASWTQGGAFTTSTKWTRVVYGNSRFVAFNNQTAVCAVSTDHGQTWTEYSTGAAGFAVQDSCVYFAPAGLFVFVGNNSSTYRTSPDGQTWTSRTLPSSSNGFFPVADGTRLTIVNLDDTQAYVSTDAINWTSVTLPEVISTHIGAAAGNERHLHFGQGSDRGVAIIFGGGVTATGTLTDSAPGGTDVAANVQCLSSIATASLSTGISMTGSIACTVSVANAALTVPISFAASIAALSSSLSAVLTTQLRLNATVACQTTITGAALATAIRAQTSIAAQSSVVSAALTTAIRPAAAVAAVASVASANLSTQVRLNGALASTVTSTAALFIPKKRGGNTNNNGNGTASLSLLIPANVRGGDLLTTGLTIAGGSGVTVSAVPAGWVQGVRTDNGTALAQIVYWKVAAGAPTAASPEAGTSPSWTFTSNKASGALDAWYDAAPTAPYFFGGQSNGSSTSIAAPGTTTSIPYTLALWVFGTNANTTQTSVPGVFSQQDASTGAGATTTVVAYDAASYFVSGTPVASSAAVVGAAAANIGQLVLIQYENSLIQSIGAAVSTVLNGSLTTQVRLAAAPAGLATVVSAGLTTQVRLAADVGSVCTVTGALAANDTALAASISSSTAVSAGLSTQVQASASAAAQTSVTNASLTTGVRPAASVSAAATAAGALTTAVRLSATATATTAVVTANLASLSAALAASVTAVAAVANAALTTQVRLAATAAAAADALTATLSVPKPLAAAPAASATATASFSTGIRLQAAVAGLTTLTGELTAAAQFAASAACVATATGALTTQVRLASDAACVATATATASLDAAALAAVSSAQASTSGVLLTQIRLAGTANSAVSAAASLIVFSTPVPVSGVIGRAYARTQQLGAVARTNEPSGAWVAPGVPREAFVMWVGSSGVSFTRVRGSFVLMQPQQAAAVEPIDDS
jgi:trimeric autotransporter adhesin